MSAPDLAALALTVRLALLTTALLLLIATPLALWLARTRTRVKVVVEAVVALPLVLPPTVLGFYLLIALNPNAPVGAFWVRATGGSLTFSFEGLVLASLLYSLPFAVQPLQAAFEGVDARLHAAAASLKAGPFDVFWSVTTPLSWRGFVTAGVLAFAHTLGEFGVILMVGGAIPGETRVVSIAIFERVETLDYAGAHALSLTLLALAFTVLIAVYALRRGTAR